MQRFILALCSLTLAACSGGATADGNCSSNRDCEPGEICHSGNCTSICLTNDDCPSGFVCRSDTCALASGQAPEIVDVDSTGAPDGSAGDAAHHLTTHLIINGRHLSGAQVALELGTDVFDAALCEESDDRLLVELPSTLVEGTYRLRVFNQSGSCATDLPLLRGSQGPTGPAGPAGPQGPEGPEGPSWVQGGASGAIIAEVTIRASGDCGSEAQPPHMALYINQVLVAEWDVPNASYADFIKTLSAPVHASEVAVAFTNDNSAGGCDHNLHVESVSFDTGVTINATDTERVIYDRGGFFDQADVLPGRSNLDWTGALRIFMAPGASQRAGLAPVQVFRYSSPDGGEWDSWTPLAYTAFTASKRSSDSRLRISWTDSYRTISPNGNAGACGWHLQVAGAACSPSALLHVQHNTGSSPSADTHMSSTVVQVCEGIPAGDVSLQVYSRRRDGDEDCYRGHALSFNPVGGSNSYPASIIVEEIP